MSMVVSMVSLVKRSGWIRELRIFLLFGSEVKQLGRVDLGHPDSRSHKQRWPG